MNQRKVVVLTAVLITSSLFMGAFIEAEAGVFDAGKQAVEDATEDRDEGEIRAYYDHQGKMVCFTFREDTNGNSTGGLDCEPVDETGYTEEDF
jgi:hypothetical protein